MELLALVPPGLEDILACDLREELDLFNRQSQTDATRMVSATVVPLGQQNPGVIRIFTDNLPTCEVVDGWRCVDVLLAAVPPCASVSDIPRGKEEGEAFFKRLGLTMRLEPAVAVWKAFFGRDADPQTFRVTGDRSVCKADWGWKGNERDIETVCSSSSYVSEKKHGYTSMDLASRMGGGITEQTGWKPLMKGMDINILARVYSGSLMVGVELYRRSTRSNIGSIHLTPTRSTAMRAMLRLADICVGDVVIDPCGGSGAIALEPWVARRGGVGLMGEVDPVALASADANTRHGCTVGRRADVVHWDATALPLRSNSVDVMVADLPFGQIECQQRGNTQHPKKLYPRVVAECHRALRVGGRLVVMTTQKKVLSDVLLSQSTSLGWQLLDAVQVDLAYVVGIWVLRKTVP